MEKWRSSYNRCIESAGNAADVHLGEKVRSIEILKVVSRVPANAGGNLKALLRLLPTLSG